MEFADALKQYKEHTCFKIEFCSDEFEWQCPTCGKNVKADGETIWHYSEHEPAGNCQRCEYA